MACSILPSLELFVTTDTVDQLVDVRCAPDLDRELADYYINDLGWHVGVKVYIIGATAYKTWDAFDHNWSQFRKRFTRNAEVVCYSEYKRRLDNEWKESLHIGFLRSGS